MTKASQAESTSSGIIPGAVLTSAFLKEAEIWMNAQGEVLSVMEAAMADWMRRQARGDRYLVAVSQKDV